MLLPTTENLFQNEPIDGLNSTEAARLMLRSQHAALRAVEQAASQIAEAAEVVAYALRDGRVLNYAAAGSSGLMALADGCELPGTFGIPSEKIRIHMAGGIPHDGHMPGHTEDDAESAAEAMKNVSYGDVVIALSASGTTPYALSVAKAARAAKAKVIGIANNPDTPLLKSADVPICLATEAEVVAGSTRLGAGTAQKVALNLMSTLVGVRLGHVYQGMMVNVVADNAKLIARARGIVAKIAGVTDVAACEALQQSGGQVKQAVLVASGATVAQSNELLETHGGSLGPCLEALLNTNT